MTQAQYDRLRRNVWERMTWGDGYQPWGYDWPTLRLTKPGWVGALARLDRLAELAGLAVGWGENSSPVASR